MAEDAIKRFNEYCDKTSCDTCEMENDSQEKYTCYHQGFYMKGYEQGKLDGAKEFAEWLCKKYSRIRQDSIGFEKFQNIYWKSIDEVLSEWQKGAEQ